MAGRRVTTYMTTERDEVVGRIFGFLQARGDIPESATDPSKHRAQVIDWALSQANSMIDAEDADEIDAADESLMAELFDLMKRERVLPASAQDVAEFRPQVVSYALERALELDNGGNDARPAANNDALVGNGAVNVAKSFYEFWRLWSLYSSDDLLGSHWPDVIEALDAARQDVRLADGLTAVERAAILRALDDARDDILADMREGNMAASKAPVGPAPEVPADKQSRKQTRRHAKQKKLRLNPFRRAGSAKLSQGGE